MSTPRWIPVALVGPLSVLMSVETRGQGSLTPPGAPMPTMLTLNQVEPRLPLSNGLKPIRQPGSYYLTGNLTETVVIDADDVTLDLMGFEIAPAVSNAIFIAAGKGRNTVVRNGSIRMTAGVAALDARHVQDGHSRFEDLRIDGRTVASHGIIAGSGCLVRNCDVLDCNNCGIIGNSANGGLEVRDCRVTGGTADGITVYKESRVIDNVIEGHGDDGLVVAGTGTYVSGNLVRRNRGKNYDLAAGNHLNLLISEIPETLEWPCSVRLAGTLTCTPTNANGITVNADDVTIDMAGHTLIGPGANSGHGILQPSSNRNLRVFNGKVVNWRGVGSIAGLAALGAGANLSDIGAFTNRYGIKLGAGCLLRDSVAATNADQGIQSGSDCVLSRCIARFNGAEGIDAAERCAVRDCVATDNSGDGINAGFGSVLGSCVADSNTGDGIHVATGSSVGDCAAYGNGGDGIATINGSLVRDCVSYANRGDGIQINMRCRVSDCVCSLNGATPGDGAGIHATGSYNHIEGNTVADGNDRGIDVDVGQNIIIRNHAANNTVNWDIAAGNVCLVVHAAVSGDAISGNSGGAAPGSTDPSVNFTY